MRFREAIRVEDEIGTFPGKLDGRKPVSPGKRTGEPSPHGFDKTNQI
jgi:hypothetical protein